MKYYKQKFANLINRLIAKWKLPQCDGMMTMEDWEAWDSKNKADYPVRFFLQDTVPGVFRSFKQRVFVGPYNWVRFRTFDRHHVLKMHDMEPHWADPDHLMLMANFQILRNFVELDLSRNNFEWWDKRRPKGMPEWIWDKVRTRTRSPEAGLDHMDAIERIYAETGQHCPAVEQRELYLWWTGSYLKRIDPWSESKIWGDSGLDTESFSETTKRMKDGHSCSAMASKLDTLYDDEEQAMLERLVAIRSTLWY
jgi:hypothetical protein